ncbi:MAG: tagaturonate reductase [Cyclobacteriaceae bacterium]
MKPLVRKNIVNGEPRPIKILQFGTGNFLRGFTDWMVDRMNENSGFNADIQMVQVHNRKPARGINEQEGLYHVLIRGYQNGKTVETNRLIQCVRGAINPYLDYSQYLDLGLNPDLQFIFSNTTEAGIYFEENDKDWTIAPDSFPAKLTALLYRRFEHFHGDSAKGLIILPCELIEDNGDKLKKIILRYVELWNLPGTFEDWLVKHNVFCNTLVDRIVPGYPMESAKAIQESLGYQDEQMVMAEPFHFWAIQGPEWLGDVFPTKNSNLDVRVVRNLAPFRTRKVRILNGGHTALVPFAYLKGQRFVREAVEDTETGEFLQKAIFEEIIPSMDLAREELIPFANDVLDRFKNPFIKHQLKDIALNSISKFKVRVLPSILGFIKKEGRVPNNLAKSFAALIVFYRGYYNGFETPLKDKQEIIDYFNELWKIKEPEGLVADVFSRLEFWEQDLNLVTGLSTSVIGEIKNLLASEKIR